MYKVVLFLLFCVCAGSAARYYVIEEANVHFEEFIRNHNKQYIHEQEKEIRFQNFKKNLEKVNRLNEESEHAEFGITKFMDLTHEEFRSIHSCYIHGDTGSHCDTVTDNDVPDAHAPDSFDWRDHGVVTPVKDQAACGSCYAFGCTGHLESQYLMKYKKEVDLSEQQIVDCDKGSYGCIGGFMSSSIK